MRKYKFLLLISIAIAIFSLGICFLIENVPPFWYSRGEFIQWFFLGFSIIGCGGVMLFFFLLYSSNKKDLLDIVNVFIINTLLFLQDFRTMLKSKEDYSDAIERIKNITAEKKAIIEEKRGFIVPNSYVKAINQFTSYVDEYAEIHKKYVPQILRAQTSFDKEKLTQEAQRQVDEICYKGYKTAKQYAKKRGSNYRFNDFKEAVGAEKYEKREAEEKAAEEAIQAAANAGKRPEATKKTITKHPKEPKKPKEKVKKGGAEEEAVTNQQQPPPQAQATVWATGQPTVASSRTQFQPQRPQPVPPPSQPPPSQPPPSQPPPSQPPPSQPPPTFSFGATGARPRRPEGTPPPSNPPPSYPPPSNPPPSNPPPSNPPPNSSKKVIKPPQGVKPPDQPPI